MVAVQVRPIRFDWGWARARGESRAIDPGAFAMPIIVFANEAGLMQISAFTVENGTDRIEVYGHPSDRSEEQQRAAQGCS